MIKAAQLPASNINVIDVPFRGRNLKIAGDRTFDVWTITVINDISFDLRNAFEQWMNGINKHDNATGVINPTQYQKDAVVYQLGRNTKTSTSGFPTTIADATLSALTSIQSLRSMSSTDCSQRT